MTDEPAFKPIDLSPKLQQEQRVKDLELMRKVKHVFPSVKYEIKDVLAEMNIRFTQYNTTSYSLDFRILQTVQDFQILIQPLQTFKAKQRMVDRLAKAKVDYSLPVAQLDKKMIYLNKDNPLVFTFDKPKGE